jgi:Flp pilus assembly protein CpaB
MPKGNAPVGVLLILLGLMCAGGAWVLGERAVEDKRAAVRRGWVMKKVIVAARDLPNGTVLKREDLAAADLPEQFATASLFTDTRPLEGKPIFGPISKGTPIHVAALETSRAACGADSQ